MADISQEINDFKNAIYGEEVRGSMISLAEKLNTEVESNTTNVNQAVATANTASTAANQAVQDAETTLQAANQAVTSAEGSAAVAAGSASAAAGHATDAQESATAAAGSASAAAASEQRAEEIAEGLEGFDGQASSIKAEDTQGLLGTAGGQTNVQALIDYIADQVKNQLVSDSALTTKLAEYILKSQIINNLLATQAGNVLDAVQGKALSDMIGDTSQLPEGAENVVGAVAQLNSDYNSSTVLFENQHNPVAFPGEIDVNMMQYRIVALLLTSSSPLSTNRTILVMPTIYPNATYYPVQLGASLIYVRLQFNESKLTLISSSGTVYVAVIYGIVK